jgi:transcriptional regulator with XRE-family HTH domain
VKQGDGWGKLGRLVRGERTRLRLTQSEFATEIGISERLLTDIETAARSNYDANTVSLVEHALGWEAGSVERVVTGQQPVMARTDPLLRRVQHCWPHLSGDAQQVIVQLSEILAKHD